VVLKGQANLFNLVFALRSPGRFSRRLNRRQQQGHQYSNDRDHDQEFDECERMPSIRSQSSSNLVDDAFSNRMFHASFRSFIRAN
jgi:hypothetical protein